MASFHLYHADCIGVESNCLYPHTVEVVDVDSLISAVSRDYVAAEYQGGYRSDTRFLWSDCLAMDCDNDHSDDPAQWVTPEIIMRLLPDITTGFHYFLANALAAFDALPSQTLVIYADRLVNMIREKKLKEFDCRTAMRNCRFFKTVAEIQPVLDFMEDYGYIFQQPAAFKVAGRPPLPKYTVNPKLLESFSHAVPVSSVEGADSEPLAS